MPCLCLCLCLCDPLCANLQVPSMARVCRGHHVLGVEHLLRELGHGARSVLRVAPGDQRSKSRHEEMKPWEGNHVDSQLPQVCVQLAREPQTCGDPRHCD